MDIEKLIERLRTESLYADKASLEIMDLCMDAATALSTLQDENEKLRETVDKYATAARVIALHLKPFCDESLPYDEMIADAARKASDELEQVKRENNALWTYIEIVDREYRRYMDRGYIDRLDELKRTWKCGQKED